MWLFLFKSMTYLFMVGILGEFTSIGILKKKKNNNPLKKGGKKLLYLLYVCLDVQCMVFQFFG